MTETRSRHAAWDGLRGVAVACVLVYHVEGHPLRGGFLGVSLFFTLSGFVITRGLVGELERAGRVSLTGFWARRFRRLLPPIGIGVVLVLLYGHLAATGNQRAALRTDLIATLTDWMNWRVLSTGVTYGGDVLDPSPLMHAWSLSIEEQAYLLLPLLAALGWRLGRRRGLAAALAVPLAASAVAGLLAAGGQQWYLGTHVRIGEILVGALLGCAWGSGLWPRLATLARAAVVPAVAFMVWAAVAATTNAGWLPRGGLLLHAVATAVLIVATSDGGWSRVLGWRPLAALGLVSYGVYLYHWPIYLWLTPAVTGWGRWPTTALRVAITLVLAVLSYVVVERPIVAMRRHRHRSIAFGGAGVAVALGIAAVAAPVASAEERITIADGIVAPPNAGAAAASPPSVTSAPPAPAVATPVAPAAEATVTPAPAAPTTTTTTTPPVPVVDYAGAGSPWFAGWADSSEHLNGEPLDAAPLGRPPVIVVTGDSAAGTIGLGLQRLASQTGTAVVYVATKPGCPVGTPAHIRWNDGTVFEPDETCAAWAQEAPELLRSVTPDLVVSYVSLWEVADRQQREGAPWQSILEPDVAGSVAADLAAYTDAYAPLGTRVLWLQPPPLRNSIYAQVPGPLPEEDPARRAALEQIIAGVAAGRANTYTYDVAAALEDRYGDPLGLVNRVDGFHWSDAGADREAQWLLPLLVAIADGAP